VNDTTLRQIRVGRAEGETVRVVLDVKDIERFAVKSFDLPLETKIVIDLHAKPQSAVARKEPVPDSAAQPKPGMGAPGGAEQIRSLNRALGLKVRTIVIDPGHGGHDPGAVANGLEEKEITLRIATALRDVIRRRRPDLNIVMTREDDRFIPLQARPRIAREAAADLFVSIHVNAHEITRFSGIETYFLNLTTDSSALEVAARENASTEKQVSDLNAILLDLLRDTNIIESGRLAKTLQSTLVSELHAAHPVRDLGVKQAPFMVLLGSDVPSVLVEAGFLSNRDESRRLNDRAYQQRIAEGIYAGLSAYMDEQTIARHAPAQSPASGGPEPTAQAALVRY
jgi:N-acetylmuramoyl-L-alanine amidase